MPINTFVAEVNAIEDFTHNVRRLDLAGCWKSPPASFSRRSEVQRTRERALRLFAHWGPCPRNGASWRARAGRVRRLVFSTILRELFWSVRDLREIVSPSASK